MDPEMALFGGNVKSHISEINLGIVFVLDRGYTTKVRIDTNKRQPDNEKVVRQINRIG